ncbi:MAG TPA: molybdenum cofactor guanylyltransferase [Sphingomicrobium sp.]|nr:molybdenum cofactor guanylyltransferase [Sphingomicrobium sp.]
MSDDIAVVIFAGGKGNRVGGDKPLRKLRGERLIDHALRQARNWSKMVAVSVRDPGQVQPTDALLLADEPGIEGPLGGLISALRFGKERGCVFVLTIAVDMPLLPFDLLTRLSDAIGGYACTIASSGGHVHPVCALWRTESLRQIEEYVATGKRSIRGFAELIGFDAVEWPTELSDPFFNINTAADLARAEQLP